MNLRISEATRTYIESRGMFMLSPVIWRNCMEYRFEDHDDQGRELRIFSTGIMLIEDNYESSRYGLFEGAYRIDSEAEIIDAIDRLHWMKRSDMDEMFRDSEISRLFNENPELDLL